MNFVFFFFRASAGRGSTCSIQLILRCNKRNIFTSSACIYGPCRRCRHRSQLCKTFKPQSLEDRDRRIESVVHAPLYIPIKLIIGAVRGIKFYCDIQSSQHYSNGLSIVKARQIEVEHLLQLYKKDQEHFVVFQSIHISLGCRKDSFCRRNTACLEKRQPVPQRTQSLQG